MERILLGGADGGGLYFVIVRKEELLVMMVPNLTEKDFGFLLCRHKLRERHSASWSGLH